MAWRDHLDGTLGFYESCCYSWRVHLDKFFREQRGQPALACIEEIETHLPVLRSGRLVDMPAQREAIEKCTILNAKLTVYAGDSEGVRLHSNSIVGPQKASQPRLKMRQPFQGLLSDGIWAERKTGRSRSNHSAGCSGKLAASHRNTTTTVGLIQMRKLFASALSLIRCTRTQGTFRSRTKSSKPH
jgi:hypothetical protein